MICSQNISDQFEFIQNRSEYQMEESEERSSSAQSKRSLANKTPEPCLVCGVPTSTLHLQVNACYACAAFYRRSINTHSAYRCQKNNTQCDLTIKTIGKPLCRLCRYNKCVEVGMTINKSRGNDEFENVTTEFSSVDLEEIYEKIKNIFEKSTSTSQSAEISYTQQFTDILTKLLETSKPKTSLTLLTDNDLRLNFVMNQFVKCAKMLSKYSPFAALTLEEKFQLHSHFWEAFNLSERCYQALQHFGNDTNDTRIPVDGSQYIDFSDLSQLLDESDSKYVFLAPFLKKAASFLCTFKKTNITTFEFAYMSQIALWSCYGLSTLSESTQNLAEKIVKQISDDLHDYYVNDLRLSSYAARQAQLFRLISFGDLIVRDKREMLIAKEIFDFGPNSFSFCQFETNYFDFLKKCRI
uniref:Nuclear receptor n=1 Tax=Panagrolaimus sp. PS1159 TaxID=55785 RepID=A0AC35GNH6_9BILA